MICVSIVAVSCMSENVVASQNILDFAYLPKSKMTSRFRQTRKRVKEMMNMICVWFQAVINSNDTFIERDHISAQQKKEIRA